MEKSEVFSAVIRAQLEKKVDARDPSTISMSSLGHCVRSLAYRHHHVEGRPLTWRSMMIFDDGNRAHEQIRSNLFLGLAGSTSLCHQLVEEEAEVELEGVVGHVDGILRHDKKCPFTGPYHKDLLLEVKSMNDRAFREVVKIKELGFEYRCQVSGYLAAAKMEHAVIICKNKNTGEMAEFFYEVEEELVMERLQKLDSLHITEGPEDVEREYGPTKSGNLPWQCNYCPFVSICWRDFGVVEKKEKKWAVDFPLYNAWRNAGKDSSGEKNEEVTKTAGS